MARKVFFSFHYERDVWRVSQIRNSWVTQGIANSHAGWLDHAEWEAVKRQGDEAIKRWINRNLEGSSVTVVCIGRETSQRKWVRYEIQRSWEMRKGLIGVEIHNMKDRNGLVDGSGSNPFQRFSIKSTSLLTKGPSLADRIPIYNWVNDRGYTNLKDWVERAAKAAGR